MKTKKTSISKGLVGLVTPIENKQNLLKFQKLSNLKNRSHYGKYNRWAQRNYSNEKKFSQGDATLLSKTNANTNILPTPLT